MSQTIQFDFSIYIPLCLYFNDPDLSYQDQRLLIYIPLCLYFNGILSIQIHTVFIIYIPLCLYFNLFPTFVKSIISKFTFHYVSILIPIALLTILTPLIYIPLCLYFNHQSIFSFCLYNKHLHSIMSLF